MQDNCRQQMTFASVEKILDPPLDPLLEPDVTHDHLMTIDC